MPEVNKEHLQAAAVLAAGLIQANYQDKKLSTSTIAQLLVQSYEAVQEAAQTIEHGRTQQ